MAGILPHLRRRSCDSVGAASVLAVPQKDEGHDRPRRSRCSAVALPGVRAVSTLPSLVDAEALVSFLVERQMFPACRVCDAQPRPPHCLESEGALLIHAMHGRFPSAFEGLDADHFFGQFEQAAARVLLPVAGPRDLEEVVKTLQQMHPGYAETWPRFFANIEERTPAIHTEQGVRLLASDVRRLAFRRETRATFLRLAAEITVRDIPTVELVDALRAVVEAAKKDNQ
jgi:hypothetical protein